MTHILDLIAEWSVRIIGTCGLALGALWMIERTFNFFWQRAKLSPDLWEFYQWKRAQKPRKAVKVTVPGANDDHNPREPLD